LKSGCAVACSANPQCDTSYTCKNFATGASAVEILASDPDLLALTGLIRRRARLANRTENVPVSVLALSSIYVRACFQQCLQTNDRDSSEARHGMPHDNSVYKPFGGRISGFYSCFLLPSAPLVCLSFMLSDWCLMQECRVGRRPIDSQSQCCQDNFAQHDHPLNQTLHPTICDCQLVQAGRRRARSISVLT
jgi:hypothetical protein